MKEKKIKKQKITITMKPTDISLMKVMSMESEKYKGSVSRGIEILIDVFRVINRGGLDGEKI